MRLVLGLPLLLVACAEPTAQGVGAVLSCVEEGCALDGIDITGTVLEADPPTEQDSPDSSQMEVAVMPGLYGAWQRLLVQEDGTGLQVEAFFLLPATSLAEVGESVRLLGPQDDLPLVDDLALLGADGALRAWVGEASDADGVDVAAAMNTPEGLAFSLGDVSWVERGSCGRYAHRDLVFDDGQGSYELPYGEALAFGGLLVLHGGHRETLECKTRVGCECGMGPSDEVRAGLVAAAYTASAAR